MNRLYAVFISTITFLFFSTPSVTVKDFKPVFGNWKGTITYKDYTTGKPFTMPANLNVSPDPNNEFQLVLIYEYPDEPKANGKDTLSFSADGKQLNNEVLVSKSQQEKAVTKIIIERAGAHGNENKKALLRHIYTISKKKFIIRKEVKFEGTQEYIMRNEYSMTR